ncbi:hypothetical protein MA16_Dca001428 [Dendrobium catenatum]|uniref:Uncharacterized protein n=1 Tax=Dendrobium catenatum TaxID=906689 RepID=A0A2I0WMD6_9ASPA|nr:hypothetical protein MA16_Dca001428 [Dendrobium catenatum]
MNCSNGDRNINKLAVTNEVQPKEENSVAVNEGMAGSAAEFGDKYGPWIHVRYGKKSFRDLKPRLVNKQMHSNIASRDVVAVPKVDAIKELIDVGNLAPDIENQKFSGKVIANAGLFKANIESQGVQLNRDLDGMAKDEEIGIKESVDSIIIDEDINPSNKIVSEPIADIVNHVNSILVKNRFDILNSFMEEGEIIAKDKDDDNEVLKSNAGSGSAKVLIDSNVDRFSSSSKKNPKGTKQLKSLGPIKLATRTRKLEGEIKVKVGNSYPLLTINGFLNYFEL